MVFNVECKICGKVFEATRSNARYCSDICYREFVKRDSAERWANFKANRPKIVETCKVCGKQFYKERCAKTCSPECAKINRANNLAKWNNKPRVRKKPSTDYAGCRCLSVEENEAFERAAEERQARRTGDPEALERILKICKKCGITRTEYMAHRDTMDPTRFKKWLEDKEKMYGTNGKS